MAGRDDYKTLLKRLEYSFDDISLLIEAFTHRSAGSANNERLEFLGDSVLNFVIASELFNRCPNVQEGDLSRLRASLVNGETLAEIGRALDLGEYLVLGAGELKSGGFRRSSIIADALESLLGAVYLDRGFGDCRQLILRLFQDRLNNLPELQDLKDAKTKLQELLQSRKIALPEYNITETQGKAHARKFFVECRIDEINCVAKGEGRSRRKAEQDAAEQAYQKVREHFDSPSS